MLIALSGSATVNREKTQRKKWCRQQTWHFELSPREFVGILTLVSSLPPLTHACMQSSAVLEGPSHAMSGSELLLIGSVVRTSAAGTCQTCGNQVIIWTTDSSGLLSKGGS